MTDAALARELAEKLEAIIDRQPTIGYSRERHIIREAARLLRTGTWPRPDTADFTIEGRVYSQHRERER